MSCRVFKQRMGRSCGWRVDLSNCEWAVGYKANLPLAGSLEALRPLATWDVQTSPSLLLSTVLSTRT